MAEITVDFSEPYSTKTSALPSSFSPSVIGIAGVPYLIDTSSDNYGLGRFRREAFDVVQQRNTSDQRDVLLLPQDVWRQQVQSWHKGAGQSNIDRDNAIPYRFNDSFGIDPWEQWHLTLHHDTQKMGTYTGNTWLTTYGTYLAVVSGDNIYWYDNVSASASVGTTVVNTGHTIIDIANTGTLVTTLHDDGKVYETAGPGSTPTRDHTYAGANFISYEKDYMLLGQTNKLYDITGHGAGTLVYTHPMAGFRWESSAGGNSCIYLLGGSSDKYVVHRVGIAQDGTGLTPAIVAATLPDGEIGYCIDSYLGFILIGTNKGVRVAQATNASGDLILGSLIPTSEPVRCFEGQDRFVWFGNSAMKSTYSEDDEYFPVGTVCGLGRLDLSTTTVNALTPAYANDICAIGETGHDVKSVVTFQDKRVFSIAGVGVFAENNNLMEAGWITQGTMSYSVEDLKTGLYLQAKWEPLKGEVDLDVAYDSSGYVRIVSLDTQGSIRTGNISLDGTQFSRIDSRIVLRRDTVSQTDGPLFTRWEMRAIPVKGRASRWTIPILNYEDIEIDGVRYVRDPLVVMESLIELVEKGHIFTLQESGRAYSVHGKDFQWIPEKLTINGKAWQGTFTLVVEEVQ